MLRNYEGRMKRGSLCITIFLLLLGSIVPAVGQSAALDIDTYRAEFSRKVEGPGEETRTINGILYFRSPETLLFDIWHPHDQMMIFKGQQLTIYYPDEKRGFLFISRQKQVLTFSQTFLGLIKDDFGLSDAGFTIEGKTEKEGVLLTYWKPPKEMRKVFGRMVVGSKNGKPFYMEGRDSRGNLLFRVSYIDLVSKGSNLFPSKVVTERYGDDGRTVETVEYYSQRVNTELPGEIRDFTVPADADIKKVQW